MKLYGPKWGKWTILKVDDSESGRPVKSGRSGVKLNGPIAIVILNTFKELYNIHPIVMLGLKKIAALEVNISILNLYEDMFYDALDEDGNRLVHLFAIHGRS